MSARLAAFLAALLPAASALATDGILEISQTCATQTGCFAGDTPGFPVTIASAGSYRLTTNLAVPNADTSGIDITTDDGVMLDLGGFVISGTNDCNGYPAVCSEAGSGSGVDSHVPDPSEPGDFIFAKNVTLRNGILRGHGNAGARLGSFAHVEGVEAIGNRWYGLRVGDHSIVRDNRIVQNGWVGLNGRFGNAITGNASVGNGQDGITANSGSVLMQNTSVRNGGRGFYVVGPGNTVTTNTASDNATSGIDAGSRSTLIGNTVTGNGVGLTLQTNDPPGYANNVISGNAGAAVTGGVALECNIINNVRVCPP
ncbi:MAG: hypothetical protein JRE43_02520 [Deltaproteobacteria bacterium]|jgi:hypothetical protein|nr:hypothetical protein [Deltaproteobacteria bacterium]